MKLSANEIKLNGLRARNCATIQRVLVLKICLRAQKVSGSFEKRAHGSLTAYQSTNPNHCNNKQILVFFFPYPAAPLLTSHQTCKSKLATNKSLRHFKSVGLIAQ